MPLLVAILLGLAALMLVIYPLLDPGARRGATAASDVLPDIVEQEQSAKQSLRDVDFDHRLGNLEDADYQALRDRYEARALAAMKTRYERESALDALIERQLAALRERGEQAQAPSRETAAPQQRDARVKPTTTTPAVRPTRPTGAADDAGAPGLRRRRGGRA